MREGVEGGIELADSGCSDSWGWSSAMSVNLLKSSGEVETSLSSGSTAISPDSHLEAWGRTGALSFFDCGDWISLFVVG